MGCHASKEAAEAQMRALYSNEPGAAATEYVTIPNVEIASVGMKWPTASGPITVRMDHLADAARAANDDPLILPPRLKIGHEDPRFNSDEARAKDHDPFAADFDGEPAVGVVRNLRLTNDGAVLVGDFTEVPRWLAEALPSAYPSRSMEGSYAVKDGPAGEPIGTWEVETEGGNRYSLVVTAVSLLGLERPAIRDLEDLRRFLVAGEGVVISGQKPKDEGVPASARTGAVARASVDKVIDDFCFSWATGDRSYWWPRELWTDPNEVLADDNEGSLFRIPFTSGEDQSVTFGEPIRVLQTFTDAGPALASAARLREGKPLARFAARSEIAILAVSDTPWGQFSDSDYSDAQYERACVLDRKVCGGDWPDKPPKTRCSLRIREPGGALNRNGVHAAAQRFGQTEACAEAKAQAAAKLRTAYRELDEEPPDSIKASEGGVSASATNPGMDPAAELRKVLGLAEDATDDDVQAKLAEREQAEGETPPAEGGEPSGGGTEPEHEPTPAAAAAADDGKPDEGTVTVDAATWRETQRKAEEGATARSEQLKSGREALLASAVKDGRFPPYRVDHYRELHIADPEGTEALIAKLQPGLVPVDERGAGGEPSGGVSATAVTEDEMLALFPGQYRPRRTDA